jgi:pilus assembly protein Flp/PilA
MPISRADRGTRKLFQSIVITSCSFKFCRFFYSWQSDCFPTATSDCGKGRKEEDDMKKWIRDLYRDERGATAVEYGIIAGVVAVALIATLIGFRKRLATMFQAAGTAIN